VLTMGAAETIMSAAVSRPKPSLECRERLSDSDFRSLLRVLALKHDYIHHPCLDAEGIEDELFGPAFDDRCTAGHWRGERVRLRERFVKMTAEQERVWFLRFNYARRCIVRILASRQDADGAVDAETATELLRWHKRVLAIRAEIVNANFPLVLAMSKNSRFTQLDTGEMISEGNMALLRSINKFDLTKGYRFSSYACRSILKAFSRVAMRVSRYRQHFPTEFEETLDKSDTHEQRDEDNQRAFLEELRNVLVKNAAHLNDMEQLVIEERFALSRAETPKDGEPKTLGEVGAMIGLTKERVRQIQNRALEKLRIAMMNRFAAA